MLLQFYLRVVWRFSTLLVHFQPAVCVLVLMSFKIALSRELYAFPGFVNSCILLYVFLGVVHPSFTLQKFHAHILLCRRRKKLRRDPVHLLQGQIESVSSLPALESRRKRNTDSTRLK